MMRIEAAETNLILLKPVPLSWGEIISKGVHVYKESWGYGTSQQSTQVQFSIGFPLL